MAAYQNQSYDDQSYYKNYEADQNQNEAGEQDQDAGDKNWSWGDEEWEDTDEVRIVSGEQFEPWKTFDLCTGEWKYPDGLMQFLINAGFRCPTPIQAYTWPPLMKGTDVIGVAKTGSGKTLGYLLPGYIKVKRTEAEGFQFDYTTGPAMLVLAPTRELCLQISEESVRFGTPAQIQTACVYGGQPKSMQSREIWKGPQCIAATPGRLNDFLKERTIKLGACGYFVLDEADRMLDMGFQPQIEEVLEYLPRERQTAFFTATWPSDVRAVARKVCDRDCTHIQVGSSENTSNKDITQHVRLVYNDNDKMAFLQNTLFKMLMETGGSALIFCKTKRSTSQMYQQLKSAGAPIVQLHGDLEQRDRDYSIKAFKDGRAKVLIATDVAQRGLDIKNVQMVVNYDPPPTLEDYTHRIGRTGRAGEKGDAYTLLMPGDSGPAANIMKAMRKTGQSIPNDLKTVAHGSAGGWGGGGGGNDHLGGGWSNYRAG